MIGAAHLCWIGAKSLLAAFAKAEIVTAQTKSVAPDQRSLSKACFEGFLTNGLNPKVSIFYVGAFSQFIPAGK